MCNGISEQKTDPDLQKKVIFGQIWRFWRKKKFAYSLWHGSLVLYMPNPDKNDASTSLILGHDVL